MFDDLNIDRISGLTSKQAAANLLRDGYNQLPLEKKRSPWLIALSILREPMFMLLVAGSVIYALLGDIEEALMLLSFVIIIMGITFYQEHKTERALEKLRDLSSPRALVIRDGQEKRIAGRDVVRDDIILISEGDRVPADAIILASNNLLVDEALLTGESVPVHKFSESSSANISNLFSGTMVVQGYGIAKVNAIGNETELGKIGTALQRITSEKSLLQKETNKLVKNLAIFGLLLCLIIAIIYAITHADIINGFLAGISLAMAILPEEFPVILTVFLALGAWRMSKENVLTRKVPTIETLGSATVLCVDKTGTITQNSMSVKEIFANGSFYAIENHADKSLPENFHQLIEYCILAGKKAPFDPMEKAIKRLGEKYLANTEHLHKDWQLIREYPLSKKLLALSHVWQSPDKNFYEIAAKGAPEAIADLCHLTPEQTDELEKKITIMADQGLRVLGVAKAKFQHTDLPTDQHKFNFEFLGLVGLADPIRETVPEAIKRCYNAGIKIIMLTGDYSGTAINIAKQIGLKNYDSVISGNELAKMPDHELQQRIKNTNIFARIVPEQKLRIINALKANNEIVAMTGDGVNDAPALKAAHIGIAMGERGTDVARESSALVLLDDDFSSIVAAVAMGRRIFTNIKKAVTYTFAIHIPIIGIALFPVLFKLPLILLPAHIVFLEMIIDPTCSIVFEAEPEEKNIMRQPPRKIRDKLFNKKILINSLIQGLAVLTACLGAYFYGKHLGYDTNEIRTVTYSSLILANLALIISNRSMTKSLFSILTTPNKALWRVIISTLIVLALILYIPWLSHLFSFAKINLTKILIALITGIITLLLLEIAKIVKIIKD